MIQLINTTLCLHTVLAALLFTPSASLDDCPGVCTATWTYSQTSSSPPCGTWSFFYSPPVNGTHEVPGCATCTPCEMEFSISYYHGSSNCCESHQGLDGGWSPPKQDASRPGKLVKSCNEVAVPGYGSFHVAVGDCGTNPASWTWNFDLTLICECP